LIPRKEEERTLTIPSSLSFMPHT
jgi:carboxypeptidase C (cathepsin A)